MKRCSNCVLPASFPNISFDHNDVCNHCTSFKKKNKVFEENNLLNIISKEKDQNRKYDCIVPISGGRDSSYVLYYTKEKLRLKVLAVNFDNEFRTDQAVENIKNAVKILGVEFISVRSQRDLAHRIVKNSILIGYPFGPGAVAEGLCSACGYGYHAAVYQVAKKNNIPLIIWGDSAEEEVAASLSDKSILENISKWKLLFSRSLFYRPFLYYYNDKIRKELSYSNKKNFKEIHFFDYIEWNQDEIRKTIQNKLGWRKPKNAPSDWRIDCILHPLLDYLCYKQYGVSKTEVGFSNMIRVGKMKRAEALDSLNKEDLNDKQELYKNILKEIGISSKRSNKMLKHYNY